MRHTPTMRQTLRRAIAILPIGILAIGLLASGIAASACGRGDDSTRRAAAPPVDLRVSAAVSLTEALHHVATAFEARTSTRVALNLAGSNTLATQIVEGAAIDVFVSADAAQMDRVAQAHALLDGTRVDILSNRLVIITPLPEGSAAAATTTASTATIAGPRDLLRPEVRRLTLGDPAAVPAGVYARQYLERAGVWTALQPKIVPLPHVRAVVTAVAAGSADAGIVYQTDAAASKEIRIAWIVPPAEAPPIVYPAAVIRSSAHPEQARAFVAFLRSPEAAAIFTAAGFTPR